MKNSMPNDWQYSSLKRRFLMCCYEFILLFGLWMFTALIYGIIAQQKHALQNRLGLQVVLYVITGLYFIISWHQKGQTLAGKTWHTILCDQSTKKFLTLKQAMWRYILASIGWFAPALIVALLSDLHNAWIYFLFFLNILFYFLLAFLLPNRQFLHDVILNFAYYKEVIDQPNNIKDSKPLKKSANSKSFKDSENAKHFQKY
jgi:uncharacterized RDD family membrane protein YckC